MIGVLGSALTQVQRELDRRVDARADGALPADEIRSRLNAEKAGKIALESERTKLGQLHAHRPVRSRPSEAAAPDRENLVMHHKLPPPPPRAGRPLARHFIHARTIALARAISSAL